MIGLANSLLMFEDSSVVIEVRVLTHSLLL